MAKKCECCGGASQKNLLAIRYYPLLSRQKRNGVELDTSLFLFAFSDASHCSLSDLGSMESNVLILGVHKSRDGAILRRGNFTESPSMKIIRTCRPSLSAESVSLYNTCDLALWLRVLAIEILLGNVFRGIVDGAIRLNS